MTNFINLIKLFLNKLFPCPFNECKGSCQCGKGGGKTEFPEATPTERQMQREQYELLKSSNQQYTQLQPMMLKAMGLKKAADGSIVEMTPEERTASYTPEQQKLSDISSNLAKSIKNAYSGGVVSQGLEDDLTAQLSGLSGKGTIGQQELGNYQSMADLVRDEAKRRAFTSGTQNYLNTAGLLESSLGNQLEQYRNLPQQNIGLVKEYANLLQPYGEEKQSIYQSRQANAQRKLANQQGNQQAGAAGVGTVATIIAVLI